jgi:hypothetical protein
MRLTIVNGSQPASRRASALWQKLHPSAKIRPVFTKADYDRHHFSMLQMMEAIAHIQSAQRACIEGDTEEALRLNTLAGNEILSALRLSRDFYAAITEHTAADIEKPKPARRVNLGVAG